MPPRHRSSGNNSRNVLIRYRWQGMKLMRKQVRKHNVYRWAGSMLIDAESSPTRERVPGLAAKVRLGPNPI